MAATKRELHAARAQIVESERRARAAELRADAALKEAGAAVREARELMGRVSRFHGI